MTERCRVFSIDGEELFPCRWAKAKRLVKENVAEKIYVEHVLCIKMLNKKQEEKKMKNKFLDELFYFDWEQDIIVCCKRDASKGTNIYKFINPWWFDDFEEGISNKESSNAKYDYLIGSKDLIGDDIILSKDNECFFIFRSKLSLAIADREFFHTERIKELEREILELKEIRNNIRVTPYL